MNASEGWWGRHVENTGTNGAGEILMSADQFKARVVVGDIDAAVAAMADLGVLSVLRAADGTLKRAGRVQRRIDSSPVWSYALQVDALLTYRSGGLAALIDPQGEDDDG